MSAGGARGEGGAGRGGARAGSLLSQLRLLNIDFISKFSLKTLNFFFLNIVVIVLLSVH